MRETTTSIKYGEYASGMKWCPVCQSYHFPTTACCNYLNLANIQIPKSRIILDYND